MLFLRTAETVPAPMKYRPRQHCHQHSRRRPIRQPFRGQEGSISSNQTESADIGALCDSGDSVIGFSLSFAIEALLQTEPRSWQTLYMPQVRRRPKLSHAT